MTERKVTLVVRYEALVDDLRCSSQCPERWKDVDGYFCALFGDAKLAVGTGCTWRIQECLDAERRAQKAGNDPR